MLIFQGGGVLKVITKLEFHPEVLPSWTTHTIMNLKRQGFDSLHPVDQVVALKRMECITDTSRLTLSNQQIALYCGISKGTVNNYLKKNGSENILKPGGQTALHSDTEAELVVSVYAHIVTYGHIDYNEIVKMV